MNTALRFRLGAIALFALLALMSCTNEPQTQTQQDSMSAKTFWLNGPQGRLFVDQGGSGNTPIVIVHSLAGNTAQWTPQLAHLRQTRRAIAAFTGA